MPESVMRHEMNTWLKKECIDIGESMFDIYHGWDRFYDALFEMSRDWGEEEKAPPVWRINQVIDAGNLLGKQIGENTSLSASKKEKLDSIIKSIIREVPPKEWPSTPEIAHGMLKLQTALQHVLMEQVVECQSGKTGG